MSICSVFHITIFQVLSGKGEVIIIIILRWGIWSQSGWTPNVTWLLGWAGIWIPVLLNMFAHCRTSYLRWFKPPFVLTSRKWVPSLRALRPLAAWFLDSRSPLGPQQTPEPSFETEQVKHCLLPDVCFLFQPLTTPMQVRPKANTSGGCFHM